MPFSIASVEMLIGKFGSYISRIDYAEDKSYWAYWYVFFSSLISASICIFWSLFFVMNVFIEIYLYFFLPCIFWILFFVCRTFTPSFLIFLHMFKFSSCLKWHSFIIFIPIWKFFPTCQTACFFKTIYR